MVRLAEVVMLFPIAVSVNINGSMQLFRLYVFACLIKRIDPNV